MRLPSAAVMLLLATAAAASTEDFEARLGIGLAELRAAAPAAPAAAPVSPKPVPGGVFLRSSYDGRIAYCSASGCRLLLVSGAGPVVPAAPGSLYFSGPAGIGHCTIESCAVLLPGVNATLPLEAGPDGSIYASSAGASWHCTPAACRRAGDLALEKGSNYVGGAYKKNGDFVASGSEGTFWCSNGRCERVGSESLLFIDGGCAGEAPERAVYGFSGNQVARCTPRSCALLGDAGGVDNFVDCAFDADGSLYLDARGAAGGYRCSEAGVTRTSRSVSSFPRPSRPAIMARDSDQGLIAADGAHYQIEDRNRDPRSAAGGGDSLTGGVTRTIGGRTTALAFDAEIVCWRWQVTSDDDDMGPSSWYNGCRLDH